MGSDPAFIEVMSFQDEESDVPDQYSEFPFQKLKFPVIVAGAGFTSTSSQRSISHRSYKSRLSDLAMNSAEYDPAEGRALLLYYYQKTKKQGALMPLHNYKGACWLRLTSPKLNKTGRTPAPAAID